MHIVLDTQNLVVLRLRPVVNVAIQFMLFVSDAVDYAVDVLVQLQLELTKKADRSIRAQQKFQVLTSWTRERLWVLSRSVFARLFIRLEILLSTESLLEFDMASEKIV
jgi:hypothetical protein